MNNHKSWRNIFPATCLPLTEDYHINEPELRAYVRWLADFDLIDGLVCNGHTGGDHVVATRGAGAGDRHHRRRGGRPCHGGVGDQRRGHPGGDRPRLRRAGRRRRRHPGDAAAHLAALRHEAGVAGAILPPYRGGDRHRHHHPPLPVCHQGVLPGGDGAGTGADPQREGVEDRHPAHGAVRARLPPVPRPRPGAVAAHLPRRVAALLDVRRRRRRPDRVRRLHPRADLRRLAGGAGRRLPAHARTAGSGSFRWRRRSTASASRRARRTHA